MSKKLWAKTIYRTKIFFDSWNPVQLCDTLVHFPAYLAFGKWHFRDPQRDALIFGQPTNRR